MISNSDHLLAAFEQADGLVNCAAITKPLPDSLDEKYLLFRETIAINLESIYILCELFYNSSISFGKKEASIVNISSIAAAHGFPGNPSYIASKAALEGLTRSLAYDYSSNNIRVNCVRPGYVETPMNIKSLSDESAKNQRSSHTLLKRWALPDEISKPVIFLLSPASSYITGISMPVDGGWKVNGFHQDL